MENMVFVGGIHGVGKTFFCNQISKKYNIRSYSASKLIEQKRNEQFARNKKIDNISGNQNLLLDALIELKIGKEFYLLDGHFCLINKDGKVSKIPEKTFFDLSPKGIIVVLDSPEKILTRLKARDNISYDINFLEKFQTEELRYSREIANRLNIPFLIHNNDDLSLDNTEDFFRKIIY